MMIDIDRMLLDLDPATTTTPEVAIVAVLQAAGWPYLMTAMEASDRLASLGVRYPPRNDMSYAETLTDLAPMILKGLGL